MLNQEEQIKRIKDILLKSLLEEATEQEALELEEWLARSVNNRLLYEKITSSGYLEARSAEANFVAKNLWAKAELWANDNLSSKVELSANDNFLYKVNLDAKGKEFNNILLRKRGGYLLRVAAVAVLLVASALFVINKSKVKHYPLNATKVSVLIGSGRPLVLTDAADIERLKSFGLKVYGDTLDYSGTSFKAKSIHTLNVPKKRSYTVKLQDGSCVVLNSESSIVYPGKFANEAREVEINGEAYFEVTKDAQKPFIVKTPYQEVLVKGTSFNVKAYSYEKTIKTTLVEGNVEIKYCTTDNREMYEQLKPNEQFSLEIENREGSKREVDVSKYISWKDGIYFFESERLEDIMNNISRWYGLTVMFKSNTLKEIVLSGKLRKDENPGHLIRTIDNLNVVEIIKSDNLIMIRAKSK